MALKDTFLTIKPRESAGPRSADRSEYQKDWALCQLMQLHGSESDYLIVFDLHDDVLVFDSEASPTLISFYQVKTKSPRHWTVADLLRQKAGKDGPLLSILGKLYSNRVSFPDHTKHLTFVSNAHIKITLKDGTESDTRDRFSCGDLADTERQKIATKVKHECTLAAEPSLDDLFIFEVSALSLADHSAHTLGKLHQFLEAFQPGHRVRVSLVYKTLKDEIARRNNYDKALDTFEDVPKKKGFGRSGFQLLLQQMNVYGDYEASWTQAAQRLNSESVPIGRIRALKERWQQIEAQRMDSDNAALFRLMRRVNEVLKNLTPEELPPTLTEVLDVVVQRIKANGTPAPVFDDDDVRVITLMGWYEAGELPSVS